MKKVLLIAAITAAFVGAKAQCVINTSLTTPGFYPDSLTGIPGAVVGTPYSTDMQFKVPADTTIFGFTIPIDSVVMGSIMNLPTGFTATFNPAGGVIAGNSVGCINISGTATAGEETGGLLSDGVYNLLINYTVYATIPFAGSQSLPQANIDYRLVVTNPVGLKNVAGNGNGLVAYPNPANDQATVEFSAAKPAAYTLEVYNYTGQLVSSQKATAQAGTNKTVLSTTTWANGTYFYKLNLGGTVVSGNLSVLH